MSDDGKSLDAAESASEQRIVRPPSLSARIGRAFVRAWRPIPVETPVIDACLESLSGVERVAEVFRFSVLSIEAAISPNGGLRAWLKLNVLIASIVAIPAMLIIPIITYVLSGFSTWSLFLVQIANNLLETGVSMVGAVLVVVMGGRIVSSLLRK